MGRREEARITVSGIVILHNITAWSYILAATLGVQAFAKRGHAGISQQERRDGICYPIITSKGPVLYI